MKTEPKRGMSRRQMIALLGAIVVIGVVLTAFNLGLYEQWVLRAERKSSAQH